MLSMIVLIGDWRSNILKENRDLNQSEMPGKTSA